MSTTGGFSPVSLMSQQDAEDMVPSGVRQFLITIIVVVAITYYVLL